MSNIRINEAEYLLANGEYGKVAIFMYTGNEDPKPILNNAVDKYTNGEDHYVFIDANLNCPWMMMVMSNINDMKQEDFDPKKHRLMSIGEIRRKKLKKINNINGKT